MNKIENKEIDKFIEDWKKRAFTYYNDLSDKMNKLNKAYNEATKTIENPVRRPWAWGYDTSNKASNLNEEAKEAFYNCQRFKDSVSKSTFSIISSGWNMRPENLNAILEKEAESKKAKFIARVEKKVGKLLETHRLTIGVNGELNGTVTGENDSCYVRTIYASGEVQCLHYRVLVK